MVNRRVKKSKHNSKKQKGGLRERNCRKKRNGRECESGFNNCKWGHLPGHPNEGYCYKKNTWWWEPAIGKQKFEEMNDLYKKAIEVKSKLLIDKHSDWTPGEVNTEAYRMAKKVIEDLFQKKHNIEPGDSEFEVDTTNAMEELNREEHELEEKNKIKEEEENKPTASRGSLRRNLGDYNTTNFEKGPSENVAWYMMEPKDPEDAKAEEQAAAAAAAAEAARLARLAEEKAEAARLAEEQAAAAAAAAEAAAEEEEVGKRNQHYRYLSPNVLKAKNRAAAMAARDGAKPRWWKRFMPGGKRKLKTRKKNRNRNPPKTRKSRNPPKTRKSRKTKRLRKSRKSKRR